MPPDEKDKLATEPSVLSSKKTQAEMTKEERQAASEWLVKGLFHTPVMMAPDPAWMLYDKERNLPKEEFEERDHEAETPPPPPGEKT